MFTNEIFVTENDFVCSKNHLRSSQHVAHNVTHRMWSIFSMSFVDGLFFCFSKSMINSQLHHLLVIFVEYFECEYLLLN